jgi:Na+-driven multidrug efflux pump
MPTFGVYLANPILSLVDTAVVGQFCDATELASLGPGCSLCDMTVFMFNFLARSLSQNDLVALRHAPVHMHPS